METSELQDKTKTIRIIIIPSIIALVLAVILFLWQRNFFDFNATVDASMLGTLGDFVGGVIGSIWALVGVILFYLALKEQRRDIATNQRALAKQIEALEIQTKEFSLQKDELIESRKVFIEQSKTLKKQQFESTFFSMLKMYTDNIRILNSRYSNGEDYFIEFVKNLSAKVNITSIPLDNHKESVEAYNELFFDCKDDISHYFRIVYRLVKFIDNSPMAEDDKTLYSKILRSQFSEKELLVLYYNSYTVFGTKFYPLILKYNLLKHLPNDSKIEFKKLICNKVKMDFNRVLLVQEISNYIKLYFKEYKQLMKQEEINEEDFPLERSLKIKDSSMIIQIIADELTEMKISFINIKEDLIKTKYNLDLNEFLEYILHHLYHKFVFSTYNDIEELDFKITENLDSNNVTYLITSNKGVSL
ncbi:putative phage abortive infection protein [Maribacter sp. IgM3_T14_3]|uniref:putative phage abortive infection protein n=1 Tax=Maribacter sp. IgM3_T14_3 TaxID=3415140 RepID=UPI003C700591